MGLHCLLRPICPNISNYYGTCILGPTEYELSDDSLTHYGFRTLNRAVSALNALLILVIPPTLL